MKQEGKSQAKIKAIFTNSVLWLIIIALVLFIVFIVNELLWEFCLISDVCISIVSAIIVTLVINMRAQLVDMKDLIIDSFTDDKYLLTLSEDRLQEARTHALEVLKKKEYPNMQQGLIQKEQKVFDAIINPYYEFFREDGVYYTKENFAWDGINAENVLKRSTTVKYILKSPKKRNNPIIGDLSISKSVFMHNPSLCSEDEVKRVFNIQHFYVSIDGGERVDIAKDIRMNIKPLDEVREFYNVGISLEYNGNSQGFQSIYDNRKGIYVSFGEAVDVEVVYDIFLPRSDNHFTSRIKYPAKSFRIDCYCNDDNKMQFYGELLGAFTKNDSIHIKHTSNNIISIEATDWLLPRNGVFILLCEKFNGDQYHI